MTTESKLGLKANWKQFTILVIVNAFVGGMIGMERTIFPEFAELEFGIASKTALLSFITAFGITKAIANYFTGKLANKIGRRNLLIFGWILALPIPIASSAFKLAFRISISAKFVSSPMMSISH
jgi:MFS family permease